MDFDSLPTDPVSPAPVKAPASTAPVDFNSLPEDAISSPSKYGSLGQQVITGLEGASEGLLSKPVSIGLEKNLFPETTNEDIVGREAENPWVHGVSETAGLGTGAFLGTGEAGLLAKGVARFTPEGVSLAGKVGAGALRSAIETGLIQGGDEIGNAMLGQADPEAPVASALTNMAYAAALGGVLGGAFGGAGAKLKQLGEAKAGSTTRQEVANFGNTWKYLQTHEDLPSALTQELHEFHTSTSEAADETRGSSGLKSQAIDALGKDVSPESAQEHVSTMSNVLANAPKALRNESLFKEAVETWAQRVNRRIDPITYNPIYDPTPSDIFKATDQLKRQLGEWGQFDRNMVPLSEIPFINASRSLGYVLKTSLEDSGVWGKLGELQAGFNKATSDFIPALKDFNSTFTRKIEGVPTIDPGKVNTYANQLGKPNAEIKQAFLKNYITKAEAYRDQINGIHESLGLQHPLEATPLSAVKGSYGETTSGSKLAQYLFNKGIPGITDPLAARIVGERIGEHVGGMSGGIAGYLTGKMISPFLERVIGRPISSGVKNYAVPAILKALSSGHAENLWQILDYAHDVTKGAQKINAHMDNLFTHGGQQIISGSASAENREKVKEYIDKGGINQQIKTRHDNTQSFAEGGEVQPIAPEVPGPPLPPAIGGPNAIANALPEHNVLLQAARGRIPTYLASLRPHDNPSKLPFDKTTPDKERERVYNRAIDLANDPLDILNQVKKGTITSESMRHFTQLYPEVYSHLVKKMTHRISEAQIKGERPDYKTRQAMSIFMATPLDSTMTPQNMQSIQMMYAKDRAMAQSSQGKGKKKTQGMNKLAQGLQTPEQGRELRLNKP